MRTRVLIVLAGLAASLLTAPLAAHAAARVGIANSSGSAKADPTYATVVTVSGSGFQSIKGGHGGIYVFFGTVKGQWRPSKGGQTGRNYLYVPDSEAQGNQGFQKFVAFPGGDTASSANGGTIKANGTWSTQMVIPGAKFNAVDRSGKAAVVDCRAVTCGIITVGAHGVKNARNETFTPIAFANLQTGTKAPATTPTAGATVVPPAAAETPAVPAKPARPPALSVDRATAVAGRVLTFNATGLTPGDQVVASLDDGVAAVGPLSVGPNGQVAGALQLPTDLTAGTHQLRLTGTAGAPVATFAVSAPVAAASAGTSDSIPWLPIGFSVGALILLLAALAFSIVRIRSVRRRAAHAI